MDLKAQKIKQLWEKRADILPVKDKLLKLGWSYEFIADVFEFPDFKIRMAKNEQKAVALADRLLSGEIYVTLKPDILPCMTARFEQQVKAAMQKIKPLVKEESTGGRLCWFEDIEECCCESNDCIRQMKTSMEPDFIHDSGDTESIGRCPVCGVPFHEFLTWAGEEMRDEWDIKNDAYDIYVILQSMPTMDYEPSSWCIANNLNYALARREQFFQKVSELARYINRVCAGSGK